MSVHVSNVFHTKWKHRSTGNLPARPGTLAQLNSANRATEVANEDKENKKKDSKATTPVPPNPDHALYGIGDYLFLDPLGQGKFSRVMLAQHYLTGEKVAIKIIDKRVHDYRVLSRLVREIAIMETLEHQNIVRLYETFETADSLFLVMEYVPGINLEEHLQKYTGRALSENEARIIFRQLVAAVDYCHTRWVVHRDLKAPNVLVMANGEIRLADFGLGNRFGLVRLKTICGSMLYYSPEIISGQKYTGPEVDCWCLGILLFRMTAGYEPFGHARTVGELRKDVVSGNYTIPSHLSDDLKRTIQKCLTLEHRKRLGVRQALRDDPWLTDHGRLPDPFGGDSKSDDAILRMRTDRERSKRQYLRDMAEEELNGHRIRRTIIYHPINSSIYFTSNATHSPSMEENLQMQETKRADILHGIETVIGQIKLRPVHNISITNLKSPIHHLFRKLKPSESKTLNKTTSTMNLSQLYKRITKDQINYYTIQNNVRAGSSTTAVSGYSTASHSTLSFDHPLPNLASRSLPHQDEFELILLVRSACELFGITYKHESKTQLSCMLTLRNTTVGRHAMHTSPDVSSDACSYASTPVDKRTPFRQRSHISTDSGASSASNNSWSNRLHKGLKRLSFPLFHAAYNQNPQQGIWSNSLQIDSSAAPGSMASAHLPQVISPCTVSLPGEPEDGTALFTIEAFSIPLQKKHESRRIVALRFSNDKGSSKVFKLATGWISEVLASSATSSAASK